MTEVSVNVLEPVPVAMAEDMVTLVAVMVKAGGGVAADSGTLESVTATTERTPRIARKRTLCIAHTFLRVDCTVAANLDGV